MACLDRRGLAALRSRSLPPSAFSIPSPHPLRVGDWGSILGKIATLFNVCLYMHFRAIINHLSKTVFKISQPQKPKRLQKLQVAIS